MVLPPLYKYLDVSGAKLTLANRTFRHAKPSDFNDRKDLTVQSIFPEDTEAALERIVTGFPDVLLMNLDRQPTCTSPRREMVSVLQAAFRRNPGLAGKMKHAHAKKGARGIYDIEQVRTRSEAFLEELNEFLQRHRVLCVSTQNLSAKMWERYADDGNGIVLRITPNQEKDSKFQLFRPVVYREVRPPLYEDTLKFLEDSLFSDRMKTIQSAFNKIIYTKTMEWEYECEYRLSIPLGPNEVPWSTLPYYPEEITEVYLGMNMADTTKVELIALARAVNPRMCIFQMQRDHDGALVYQDVTSNSSGEAGCPGQVRP